MKKKVLYYNWVPFDDDEKRGGGVTVYQKNLIDELKDKPNIDLYFLCSGLSYNFSKRAPFIEPYKNCYGDKCHSFRVVNSPVLSPAFLNFKNIKAYLEDRTLLELFVKFCKEHGPFEVIHFNNFEGLSLNVFKIKDYFPKTKVIYSLHNYYSFCPQVNLWKNEEENCKNNHCGKDCVNCVITNFTINDVKKADMLSYYLKNAGFTSDTKVFQNTFKLCRFAGKVKYKLFAHNALQSDKSNKQEIWENLSIEPQSFLKKAEYYRLFSAKSVDYINKYTDIILAVSDRVREIAIERGLNKDKVITNYIGTKFANNQIGHSLNNYDGLNLNLIYMGYARRDKGFFFFMDCLDKVPTSIAQKISLYFAVKTDDIYVINRMKSLRERYHGVYFKNGYIHSDLEKMLKKINLGVIPVLWEDNLPQVAIELNAEGIPVLSSDLGGASELSKSSYFKFKGGDMDDLVGKLSYIVEHKDIIQDYWSKRMILKSMNEHILELEGIYGFNF